MATSYDYRNVTANDLNLDWFNQSGNSIPQNSFTGLPSVPITDSFGNSRKREIGPTVQSGSGLDWFKNFNNLQALFSGLQSIGGLYNAYNMNKLAKKQFQFTKDFAQENLNNQVQTYNNSKEDLAYARFVSENPDNLEAARRATDEYMGKQGLRKKEF